MLVGETEGVNVKDKALTIFELSLHVIFVASRLYARAKVLGFTMYVLYFVPGNIYRLDSCLVRFSINLLTLLYLIL